MSVSAYARHAQAYQRQAVLTASPGQLVLMLYDGTLRFLHLARVAFPEADTPRGIERIHQNLTKATNILAELQSNLDLSAGGDYAENLSRLYDYYQRRLHEANLQKVEAPVIEVEGLVSQLREAWAEMLSSGVENSESSDPRAANY